MGFNSAFKGLSKVIHRSCSYFLFTLHDKCPYTRHAGDIQEQMCGVLKSKGSQTEVARNLELGLNIFFYFASSVIVKLGLHGIAKLTIRLATSFSCLTEVLVFYEQ